jgi:hypothetical protein
VLAGARFKENAGFSGLREGPLEDLRAVPGLYLTAMHLDSNRARAEAIVHSSSLASLVNLVNLDKPWEQVPTSQWEETDSLNSLPGSLALSLKM